MIHGKNKIYVLIIFFLTFSFNLSSEDKISTVPLVNLENLKPSYENVETDEEVENNINKNQIKNKKVKEKKYIEKYNSVNIVGLDKITAKIKKMNIKIGETKIFGLLEIKAIKCGIVKSKSEKGDAAYIQVKDISDNQNEKVFVFNGWTFFFFFSIKPIDHPVYDLWLESCASV